MIREKIDASKERQIILYSIISTKFLSEIRSKAKPELFKTPYASTIWGWLASYYDEYAEAPNKDIQSLYVAHKLEVHDDEEEEAIAAFLQSLSDSGEEINNIEYAISQAIEWLNIRAQENLIVDLKEAISRKDVEAGNQAIAEYSSIKRHQSKGVTLLADVAASYSAFHEEDEVLFTFPGAVGATIGDFCRTDFVAFLAFAKRGKCVDGDTQITLQDGRISSIRDVVRNKEENILCLDENNKVIKAHISQHFDNGVKPIYEIVTRTGRKIRVTKNHPLLSFDKEWCSIEDGLAIGDYIAVPKHVPFFGSTTIPDTHIKILAYLLADGGLTPGCVTYTKIDPVLLSDCKEAIYSLGDIVHKQGKISWRITKKKMGPQKSETALLLEKYGVKRVLSIHKEIPDIIFSLCKEQLALFLRILFSGDGCIYKDGIEYSSGSEKMIRQISHLLLRFGIIGRIRSKYVKGGTYWIFTISSANTVCKFIDVIGFFGGKEETSKKIYKHFLKKKQRSYLDSIPSSFKPYVHSLLMEKKLCGKFSSMCPAQAKSSITIEALERIGKYTDDALVHKFLDEDIFWDRIKEITYIGKRDTYDITVPVYHNFIANDICSHNSWCLWEAAKEAMFASNKVLFISLEMPLKQVLKRIWRSLSKKPKRNRTVRIPYFIEDEASTKENPLYAIDYEEKEMEGFSPDVEWFENWIKRFKLYFHGGDLKVVAMPSRSIEVKDIDILLNNYEYYEKWVPDVIIVDSADLIGSSVKGEFRHKLDDIWANLRRIALERNLCVITASHSNIQSAKGESTIETISEDKRKVNHVTKMIAINATEEERMQGMFRIAQIAERDEEQHFEQSLVISCLDLGQMFLDSRFLSEVVRDAK